MIDVTPSIIREDLLINTGEVVSDKDFVGPLPISQMLHAIDFYEEAILEVR